MGRGVGELRSVLPGSRDQDAEEACGPRHARGSGRRGHRWGRTQGKIGFHAGKVGVERPRVRDLEGKELALPSWQQAVEEDWLGQWAMNLMLIDVSARKIRRAVRLPEGDIPHLRGPACRSPPPRGTS